MNRSIDTAMFGLACVAALWLVFLWAAARLEIAGRSLAARLAFGAGAVLLLFAPVAGRPLWSWAFSFCPNPSMPLLGLVCAGLWRHLCGVRVFAASEWRAAWVFGAAAGTLLYLHPFCFTTLDLYNWGWDDGVFAWAIAGLAVVFLCWGNRLGVLFIAALAACELGALESHNGWDYIIDPFYWLTGCGVLTVRAVGWTVKRRRENRRLKPDYSGMAASVQPSRSEGLLIGGRSPLDTMDTHGQAASDWRDEPNRIRHGPRR